MKQLPVSLPKQLRELLESSADDVGHSIAEEIRLRHWFSFYQNPSHIDMQSTRNRVLIVKQ